MTGKLILLLLIVREIDNVFSRVLKQTWWRTFLSNMVARACLPAGCHLAPVYLLHAHNSSRDCYIQDTWIVFATPREHT